MGKPIKLTDEILDTIDECGSYVGIVPTKDFTAAIRALIAAAREVCDSHVESEHLSEIDPRAVGRLRQLLPPKP